MLSELRLQIRADAKRLKDFEKESNEIIFSLEKKLKHTEKNLFQRGRTIQELTEKLNGTKSTRNIYTVQRHKVNKEMCRLNEVLQHTLSKLHDTEIELEETKTRLSKAMGVRLTDNNPNIADLSDRNRPTKLAERFTELYDNQWTDAFECIYKYCHSETKTIDILLYILQDSMTFCQFKEQEQMQQLQCAFELSYKQVHRKCSNDSPKSLKDCRKALSSYAMRNLYEMYISHIKDSEDRVLNKALEIGLFTKECIELCWLMAIQDPPIVFADELRRGCNFDTNLLKPYTTSGTFVDYIVWPALLLYKNGPVLVKGVAQGYGRKSDNQQMQFDKSKDDNVSRLSKSERNNDSRKMNIDRNSQKDESGGFYFANIPGQSHFNTAKRFSVFRKASHIPIGFDLVNTEFSKTNNDT
ncbi:uncharacterized protein LOC132730042 [Ruditapes philippinarum]|uniref:uncharacterized protein LOC132730042 n=1 Tax=Ruditapes philippinarum TaxID=129788 RepID=UPI00295A7734|nr:uncharacterized protein LOC132730042 [Ruditapes philippinarum]